MGKDKHEVPATQTAPLGVDLGNTNGCVAVQRGGVIDVIANDQGSRTTPAVVAFTEAEQLVGEPAKGQAGRNPSNTVFDVMTLLGRRWDDPALQVALPRWRFQVSRGKAEQTQVDVSLKGEQKSFTPARLASLLLAQLRGTAEALLGATAKEAVLAIPEDFGAERRQALQEAAATAGLRVKHMLSAPLAVALLYGSQHELPDGGAPEQLLVVDVGGSGTCVAVVQRAAAAVENAADADADADGDGALRVARGAKAAEEYTVRCCERDDALGAATVDGRLRQYVLREIKRRQRADLSDNARAMARLLAACEAAKLTLSTATQAAVAVEADAMDYCATVSRAALDEAARPLCQGVVALARRALDRAGVPPDGVRALLLAGGGARVAAVQAALGALAPRAAAHFGPAAEESVARGAAAYGALVGGGAGGAEPGGATAALHKRRALPRALALRTAARLVVLAHARSALPLARAVALAPPPPGGPPLLLQLVELPPADADAAAAAGGADAAADAEDAEAAAAAAALAAARTVLQLRLPPPPEGAAELRLELSVDADGALAVRCEARAAEDDGAPHLLLSRRIAAPARDLD